MATESPLDKPEDAVSWCRTVESAAREAVQNSIRRHRLLGEDVVIWREGAVAIVSAAEIPQEWAGPTR